MLAIRPRSASASELAALVEPRRQQRRLRQLLGQSPRQVQTEQPVAIRPLAHMSRRLAAALVQREAAVARLVPAAAQSVAQRPAPYGSARPSVQELVALVVAVAVAIHQATAALVGSQPTQQSHIHLSLPLARLAGLALALVEHRLLAHLEHLYLDGLAAAVVQVEARRRRHQIQRSPATATMAVAPVAPRVRSGSAPHQRQPLAQRVMVALA
jgi:hypothetical protein